MHGRALLVYWSGGVGAAYKFPPGGLVGLKPTSGFVMGRALAQQVLHRKSEEVLADADNGLRLSYAVGAAFFA